MKDLTYKELKFLLEAAELLQEMTRDLPEFKKPDASAKSAIDKIKQEMVDRFK